MIWLAIVALGNMIAAIWLIRENRRLTQMVIARHTGDFTAMVRAENAPKKRKSVKEEDESYSNWRNPSEGVSP